MNSAPNYKASFLFFAALPVVFFLLFGFHGMDVADRGFIPAFAHRIVSGEVIYQDFFYVRPPLTPYLHTFEMVLFPDSMEMVAYRFFFYAFVWLSVLFSILSLKKFFDFGKIGISPWVLGSMGFLLSVHNFFPAPWHTLDGIVFASLGIYLISSGPKLGYLVVGMFSLGLAAMTKQPFAIVPVAGTLLLFFLYPWKKAALALAGTAFLAILCILTIEYLLTPDFNFFEKMIAQTTGVTSFEEMKWSAFKLYVRPALASFVPAAVIWYVVKHRLKSPNTGKIMAVIGYLGIAVVAVGPLVLTILENQFVMPKSGFYHALLFTGGMIVLISMLRRDRRGLAVVLAMMVVAWASSVSWGYATPVLYSLPSLFAIVYFVGDVAKFTPPKWFWASATGICLLCISVLNLYVYHDNFRTQITHDLGPVFPRLSHIKAGQEQFDCYNDLKTLYGKYGPNFTVLPSMPAAHYVTETQPRVPADWNHDAEINYKTGIDQTISILEQDHNYVFALKDELHRADESGTFRCSVLRHVLDHWTQIDETKEFVVYENAVPVNAPD
jgi:hypothetical protein